VLAASRLTPLLLFVPVSWVVWLVNRESVWVFALAALSLIPLAGFIGTATEELAARTGPTLGGLLNATFGNAAELIIGLIALHEGRVELVQASITGSIIGNLLLVFGLSMVVGGLGRPTQHFNRTSAGNATAMLFLGVVALAMPAVYDLTLFGSLVPRPPVVYTLSFWTSLLLIGAYAASVVYTFTTSRDLLRSRGEDPQFGLPAAQGMLLLAVATLLTALQAELLVAALEPTLRQFGLTELFVGVIIVATVGNAAEHYSAIVAAYNDHMTLALEIAVGSSAQIALFVAPLLVLVSFALGQPMSLLFNPFEIAAIGLSVAATAITSLDGESNWVEGVQLLAVYVIMALAFYLIPAQFAR
jgi:Ca2+:H+ antiporter